VISIVWDWRFLNNIEIDKCISSITVVSVYCDTWDGIVMVVPIALPLSVHRRLARGPLVRPLSPCWPKVAGTFVPRTSITGDESSIGWNFRPRERKFYGTFGKNFRSQVLWNFRSLELSSPGIFVPRDESSMELSTTATLLLTCCCCCCVLDWILDLAKISTAWLQEICSWWPTKF